jgi:hypothetical protein
MAMTVSLTSKGKAKTATPKKAAAKPKPAKRQRLGEAWSGAGTFDSHTFTAMPIIQPKLKVGDPNDQYEQEADRVADDVMRMPDSEVVGVAGAQPPMGNGSLAIQRKCTACAKEEETLQRKNNQATAQPPKISTLSHVYSIQFFRTNSENFLQKQGIDEKEEMLQMKQDSNATPVFSSSLEAGIRSLKGTGRPLSLPEQQFFEPRFRHKFSQVRIHEGSRASESARSINAVAYTIGNDIVFGSEQHSLQTQAWRKILAHELVHTLQQSDRSKASSRKLEETVQRYCAPPNADEIEGSTGGCAPEGASVVERKDTGELVENIIASHSQNKAKRHPQIPRGTKQKGKMFKLPDKNKCPNKDTPKGEPDFYIYQKPFFYMAELKPLESWSIAEEEYRHYARRFTELVSRKHTLGECPAEERGSLSKLKEDEKFNNKYLNGDLDSEPLFPREIKDSQIPSHNIYAGDFQGRHLAEVKELFFCNTNYGGVIYWCSSKKEQDEENESSLSDIFYYLGLCALHAIAGEFIEDPLLCGILLGGIAELVPYYDQVADARDVIAHLYYILYAGQHDSPGRWLAFTFTLIGLIPEFGTVIQKTGKLAKKAVNEGLDVFQEVLGDSLFKMLKNIDVDVLRKTLETYWDKGKKIGAEKLNKILNSIKDTAGNLKIIVETLLKDESISSGIKLFLSMILSKLNDFIDRLKKKLPEDKIPQLLEESFDLAEEYFQDIIDKLLRRREEEQLPLPFNKP